MTDETCCGHASDCAVHNGPAYEPGPCDCGEGGECVTIVAPAHLPTRLPWTPDQLVKYVEEQGRTALQCRVTTGRAVPSGPLTTYFQGRLEMCADLLSRLDHNALNRLLLEMEAAKGAGDSPNVP